jgi:hypothetical protein
MSEPAFSSNEKHDNGSHYRSHRGMSLRDYFAAQALTGVIAAEGDGITGSTEAAQRAYAYADAMMQERKP